jgi:heptosyltransferase-1
LTRILLIKTSSLGDVIHCLPAVSDLARRVERLTLDWVIEEPLAEIPRLHPAVTRVIPVRIRYWRRHLLAPDTWREFADFRRSIAELGYDRVIDAQGLIRSALLARLARGVHCGYDAESVREPPASLFYDRRFPASVAIHAAARMRALMAQAVGYEQPDELDYGLGAIGGRPDWVGERPYLVALHASARDDKTWAEANWVEFVRRAKGAGFEVLLPWGGPAERERAERIVAAAGSGRVAPRLGFTELAAVLADAAAVVGVDTGLTHLASAVGAPVVAIYAASWSELNGVIGPAFIANLGGPGTPPSVDEVWSQTELAVKRGRAVGAWQAALSEPSAALKGQRRFRPSNARAVVHRR